MKCLTNHWARGSNSYLTPCAHAHGLFPESCIGSSRHRRQLSDIVFGLHAKQLHHHEKYQILSQNQVVATQHHNDKLTIVTQPSDSLGSVILSSPSPQLGKERNHFHLCQS